MRKLVSKLDNKLIDLKTRFELAKGSQPVEVICIIAIVAVVVFTVLKPLIVDTATKTSSGVSKWITDNFNVSATPAGGDGGH